MTRTGSAKVPQIPLTPRPRAAPRAALSFRDGAGINPEVAPPSRVVMLPITGKYHPLH
ncbi:MULTISPECIES: hypothetical protein [unclassified Mameliella]|uniref:hypothetical protein n=1 Tax=unclassified Mameliella TaxID=2630630 RepID=UPI00273EE69A|nr:MULTISPECIES: hypothetical protein [unclassified Mameliella]